MIEKIENILKRSSDRNSFFSEMINEFNISTVAELGVYRGDFARAILKECQGIDQYTMIDPWRNLSNWNKPANKNDTVFEEFYQETMQKTDFARDKRNVLRGKTVEVIDKVEEGNYGLIYIDGDHTLKGITIDMIKMWPKVKPGGFLAGDDFNPSIWQHSRKYEPTMVFPFAVYFAEAVNAKIYALPYNQFVIAKEQAGFELVDLSNGKYNDLELSSQLSTSGVKSILKRIPFISKLV